MKRVIFILILLVQGIYSNANTLTVINTNDAGIGSLRDMVALANAGDTIRFSSSLISNGNNTITLNSEISFRKSLTFKGLYNSSDTLFISGNNQNKIFNCDSVSTFLDLLMDSIVLINGNSRNGNGGALPITNINSNDIRFELNNSIISNNKTGSFFVGGGISIVATGVNQISIKNSLIKNNTSLSGGGFYFSKQQSVGGINQDVFLISNSLFSKNRVNYNGGGFYINSIGSPKIEIMESTIESNESKNNGGGFYLISRGVVHFIEKTTWTKNIADRNGGAIFIELIRGNFNISNSTLVSNLAKN